jgi:hypothetical protein
MTWQPNVPPLAIGTPLNQSQEWQRAFLTEWYRLSEGCADLEQTADFAAELYASHGTRSAVEVAREEWGTPA